MRGQAVVMALLLTVGVLADAPIAAAQTNVGGEAIGMPMPPLPGDPSEVVPRHTLTWWLEDSRVLLQWARTAATDQGAPTATFDRIDDLERRVGTVEASTSDVLWGDLYEIDDALFRLLDDVGVSPFDMPPTALLDAPTSAPDGASAPVTPPVTTVPVATPPTTVAAAPPTAAPATTVPATIVGADVDEPATPPAVVMPVRVQPEGTDVASLLAVLLGAIGLAALLAVAAYFVDRARRAKYEQPTGGPGFNDLIDVGRRLTDAGTVAEAEELAVRHAVRLTDAEAGAFVRHTDRRFELAYETIDGLMVPDRLRDGLLNRVIGAGHDLSQVSNTEPAIRNLPASVVATPVFVSGTVAGAIVLVRDADEPFSDSERRMASDLKSVVGAGFEQAAHTERARAEAMTDGLTGVQNRRALDLAVEALDGAPFAAVMVDLDRFKRVNDTFGHQAGDRLLAAVARRIAANIRPGDEVYRYGGEEFAVVLPHTDAPTAADVAERVRIAIAGEPFGLGDGTAPYAATASFGAASGTDGARVFGCADEALYEAKQSGRNRVVVAQLSAAGPR